MPKHILLSIKPKYAQGILDGRKTIELRKRSMNLEPGDWVILYATLPTGAIVGGFQVDSVISASPDELWKQSKGQALVSHEEFMQYYADHTIGYGVGIRRATRLKKPISLAELRRIRRGFQPPQSFRNLNTYSERLSNIFQKIVPKGGKVHGAC